MRRRVGGAPAAGALQPQGGGETGAYRAGGPPCPFPSTLADMPFESRPEHCTKSFHHGPASAPQPWGKGAIAGTPHGSSLVWCGTAMTTSHVKLTESHSPIHR